MPLYEYRCSDCGRSFEELRRMQDADRASACPTCGSAKLTRELSTFASRVSGGGTSAGSGAPSAPSCGSGGFA